MSGESDGGASGGVSLFPFLAVLLCTMGALIVVLVVLSRQVHSTAKAPPELPRNEEGLTAQEELDLLNLEAEQLRQQRAATEDDLNTARLELGQIEDHSRQLERQLAELQAAAEALAAQAQGSDSATELAGQLADLQRRKAAAEEALKTARQHVQSGKKSYAIIPYEGESGTDRRPIYIECRDETVVIQPEGISFTSGDFEGPLGPGNPLASAVRAIREYWVLHGRPPENENGDSRPAQPYPLLLVRASGIRAYYVARAALRSWESEFGYELVDDDWNLEFPNADPQLAGIATQAAVEARQREALAAAAAPRLRAQRTRTVIGSSPTGRGMVRQEVPVDGNGGSGGRAGGWVSNGQGGQRWFEEDLATPSGSLPYASVEVPAPTGAGAGGTGGNATDGQLAGITGPNAGGTESASEFHSGGDGSAWPSQIGGAGSDQPTTLGGVTPGGSDAAATGQGSGPELGSAVGDEGLAGLEGPHAPGSPRAGQPGTGASHAGDASSGEAGSAGQTEGSSGTSPGTGSLAGGDGGSPQSGGRRGGRPGGTPGGTSSTGSPNGSAGGAGSSPLGSPMSGTMSVQNGPPPDPNAQPMADRRGKNWGVPQSNHRDWPVTRPVRIVCCGDRLILADGKGRPNSGKVIPLEGSTELGIDELVSGVWEQTRSWGIAGEGMYWHPVLSCDVAPGGEGRFADLGVLLADSGLEVRRRSQSAPQTATQPSPRRR